MPEKAVEENQHVLVLTDTGLAAVIAGLRNVRLASPEVEPLLEMLEKQLHESRKELLITKETHDA